MSNAVVRAGDGTEALTLDTSASATRMRRPSWRPTRVSDVMLGESKLIVA